MIKKLLLALTAILLIAVIAAYLFLQKQAPQYEGKIVASQLNAGAEVIFDDYGIPHIYADNAEDAYFALGFAHAQDRLFQMELIRRLISGRLAEFLGEDLIETDKRFRTLGLRKEAERYAKIHASERTSDFQKQWFAYIDGINHFINTRPLPIEYTLLGIEAEEYTSVDAFSTSIYMALGFASGYKGDMMMNKIKTQLGEDHLKDWYMNYSSYQDSVMQDSSLLSLSNTLKDLSLPIPIWTGSNAWVVAADKTASGKAILANDTHIGYSQPSVWYEAHLEYPGFNFYGSYLAGVPFAAIGHSHDIAWGMTIFPADITDIYLETINPDNPKQVMYKGQWVDMDIQEEKIKVKGQDDVVLQIRKTNHGPIINDIFEESGEQAASFWWSLYELNGNSINAFYDLARAKNIEDARAAAELNDILGLNILYADKDDNIAWWASGRLPKRPAHVNPALFLDGASGKDEPLGYYDFSLNPQEENPERGFIVSSNNEPVFDSIAFPGNYLPPSRFERLTSLLSQKKKWTIEDMGPFQGDTRTYTYEKLVQQWLKHLKKDGENDVYIDMLTQWNGSYNNKDTAPTLFSKLCYHTAWLTLEDELGTSTFENYIGSYTFRHSLARLFQNENSPWWDNKNTDATESMSSILQAALATSISELTAQLGDDPAQWHWDKVHILTHQHPLGRVSPLDKLFNVGPFHVDGGDDTPDKASYSLNKEGVYQVTSGAALRILLDFADVEHSLNVIPTGQSGNFMSPHYQDQAALYNATQYRKQLMNKAEIEAVGSKVVFEKQ